MLVLSREVGTSILVDTAAETSIVTVLKLHPQRQSISIRVERPAADDHVEAVPPPVELGLGSRVQVGDDVQLSLVDLRGTKARVGITAPSTAAVHRLEVYEAIQRENRAARDRGPEGGLADAAVPRPVKPKPPSLSVRLREPPTADSGGE